MTSTKRSHSSRRRQIDATNCCINGIKNATVVVDDSSSTSSSLSFSESLEEERVQGEGQPRLEARISPALLRANIPTGPDPPVGVFRVHQPDLRVLTPLLAAALQDAEKSDGAEWLCAAIAEAVKKDLRTWRYCETILERWCRDGFRSGTRLAETSSRAGAGEGISPLSKSAGFGEGPGEGLGVGHSFLFRYAERISLLPSPLPLPRSPIPDYLITRLPGP